jgi:SAM-dependent methyltransferase
MNACYCGSRECSNGLRHRSRWGTVQMVRCSSCGAYRTADFPTADQAAEMYAGETIYRPPSEKDYQTMKRRFVALADELGEPQGRRLLEIGSNAGYALEAFQEKGWEVTGCEANASTADHARAHVGCRVVGSLGELGRDERFDLILLSHVLEHIIEPLPFLEDLAGRLGAGGRLCVLVPNYGSLVARHLYRNSWASYLPFQHVWYFDPRSLRRLSAMAGLRLARMRTNDLMPFRGRSPIVTLLKFPVAVLQRLVPMQGEELLAVFEGAR